MEPCPPALSRHPCWAVVPVKRLRWAKSRLARALRAEQRAALARAGLARTLDVLAEVEHIVRVIVVTSDLTAQKLAVAKRAAALAETGSGLNAAVSEACEWAAAQGAPAALIVPTDLPLLTAWDIRAMIGLAAEPACVVLAPDRHEAGTNAMLLKPPQVLQPAFGPASLETHRRRARSAGLTVHIYRSPTIELDLDWPADLDRYHAVAALDALSLYE